VTVIKMDMMDNMPCAYVTPRITVVRIQHQVHTELSSSPSCPPRLPDTCAEVSAAPKFVSPVHQFS